MISDAVRAFLQGNAVGVLGTLPATSRLRQSVVYFAVDGDRILISTEGKRGKARDVNCSQRASLCVLGTSPPYPSATLEGPARVLTTGIGADTAAVMARILGKDSVDPMAEEDLAAADRVIIEMTVERVYGISYINAET